MYQSSQNKKTSGTKQMEQLEKRIQNFITSYGENGYQTAKAAVLSDMKITEPVRQVMKYFIEECWPNRQHPALISLACEAVGGKRDAPDELSAALVLLSGAADIHDDIIDKSKSKGAMLTAYGKFSQDVVLLAGDILLLKALTLMASASEKFSPQSRQAIRTLVQEAFEEIGCATAKERAYKGNFNVDPDVYWKILTAKGAVSDAYTRVGAIVGGGSPDQVAALGQFGRVFGVLMAVKYEFLDLLSPVELWHRAKHEVLPFPILCAMQDNAVKKEVLQLLQNRMTTKRADHIVELAMGTKQVQSLMRQMRQKAKQQEAALNQLKGGKTIFVSLLELSTAFPSPKK
jgi:geranylgeranyl pyrophosphate synthase